MSARANRFVKKMSRGVILFASLLLCISAGQAQTPAARPATAAEVQAGKSSEGGAIFKIPKGYMPAPFADFKGIMMLDPKKPAGMFVAYPNEGETTDSLRRRARAAIVKMFIHNKDLPDTAWQQKPLPQHTGDSGTASVAAYSEGEIELQIAAYERTENSLPVVYGYFAMRHKSGKGDDGRFLDEQGKGVKDFDKLWQSFGGQKKQ